MRRLSIAAALAVPVAALAVAAGSEPPPVPTATTRTCTGGMVWDATAGGCVPPERSGLDDDALYHAAREFAHAGHYEHALGALRAMSDPTEDRVLHYLGVIRRGAGDADRGLAYYEAAIRRNPDDLLARSYLGQAFVKLGALERARHELDEIRARGGGMTWAEISLATALPGSG